MDAALLALGSAIVGAIVGAYLQKRWTPDPSPEIAALRKQVAAFQERIETLEHERAESEHIAVTMSLQQAVPGNYMMLLKNDSDEEVVIEGVNLAYKDVGLSGFARPPSGTSWSIAPRNGKQICWQPPTDPVSTLILLEPGLNSGTAIPIETILRCRIRGQPHLLRGKQIVTADYINHHLTPFGP